MKYLASFILLFSITTNVFAQQDTSNISIELLEQYLEESTTDDNNGEIYDLIENLLDDPIDINSASVEELMEIPFIDIKSARKIIGYRDKNGKFFSIKEVCTVPDITKETYQRIKYFIKVTQPREQVIIKNIDENQRTFFYDNINTEIRGRVIYDLKERKGFSENIYEGDRVKNYTRLKSNYNKQIRLGLLLEKDAGETSYYDHYAFYVEGRDIGFNNQIVVGDYNLEFGQGLVLWSPYAFSKGSDAINPVIRRASNIKGYTGSDENRFYRGGSFTGRISDFTFSLFYSKNDLDANLNNLDKITSLPIDGFHRTESERFKKKLAYEKMAGGMLNYSANHINLGILYSHSEYSHSFEKKDIFSIEGKSFNYFSSSYKFYFKNLFLSGETAYNGKSVATINTLQIIPTNKFSFVVSVRSYPRNYLAVHANGFGERSNTQNEFGIYTGLKWRARIGEFNVYYDQFKFPYSVSSIPLPSKGNEFLVNYQTSPFRKFRIVTRYKNENKEDIYSVNNEDKIYSRITNNFRLEARYTPITYFIFRTRAEYIKVTNASGVSNKDGFLVFQDISYSPNSKLTTKGRFVYFNTDSYASRIYEFENDLRGVMYNPGLYGKGYRFYLILRYKILNIIDLSAKYAATIKPNESEMGSGTNLIYSSTDDRLSLQLDIQF